MRTLDGIRRARGARWLCVSGVLAAGVASIPQAGAATATSTFNVTMTIQGQCTVASTTNLQFGAAGVLTSQITATSTIGVQCTNTTPYNVGLDPGSATGATVTSRKMTGGAATVNYALYRDSGYTQNWGQTIATDTVSGTGNGAVQNLTVYGQVPAQTTPAPGAYTDTVKVTVTY